MSETGEVQRSHNKALWFSILVGALCIGVATFQWPIIDVLTPILFPFLTAGLTLLLLLSAVTSLVRMVVTMKTERLFAAVPLAVNCATVMIVLLVPLTDIWLKANYNLNKKARAQVVRHVHDGTLKPNVNYNGSLIHLPDSYPNLSMGGNDIVVRPTDGAFFVFFFTFRGILDNYSGFLYVPQSDSPSEFAKWRGDEFFQVVSLEPQWYFVASR